MLFLISGSIVYIVYMQPMGGVFFSSLVTYIHVL